MYIFTTTNPEFIWAPAFEGELVRVCRSAKAEPVKENANVVLKSCIVIQYWVKQPPDPKYPNGLTAAYSEKFFADENGLVDIGNSQYSELVKAGCKISLSQRSGAF